MVIPTYTQGYPPDGSSLGQTKSVIRDNLDGTFLTVAVDHVNNNGQPGSQPAGYHTIIHEVTQTNVTTETGYNQIFSGVPGTLVVNGTTTPALPNNSDTQLYSLTGAGVLSQLTGFSAANGGYQWIGGLLFMFGEATFTGTTIISYPITLNNAAYSIQLTQFNSGSSNIREFGQVLASTTTGFTIRCIEEGGGTSGNSRTFYWLAIGR